jgi:hypothetical protein
MCKEFPVYFFLALPHLAQAVGFRLHPFYRVDCPTRVHESANSTANYSEFVNPPATQKGGVQTGKEGIGGEFQQEG